MPDKAVHESGWTTEIGPDNTVVIRHGEESDPITLDSLAAARLAIGLLSVSVINSGPRQRPATGSRIGNVHFPVTAWTVGRSATNGEPVLLVTLPGGPVLMLQLTDGSALSCGQALVREARAAQPPAGQKPN